MTTSPVLARTVNDRAVMMIMTGALSDLEFTKGGHVVHCGNREAPEADRIHSAILIRVEHDGMHLTAEGAEFILENLSRCMSKHDEKALQDFERASYVAYQQERLVIDQHIVNCEESADLVADARVNQADDHAAVRFAYTVANSALNDAKAALTDAGYRKVLRAYHRRLDAVQTAKYNDKLGAA